MLRPGGPGLRSPEDLATQSQVPLLDLSGVLSAWQPVGPWRTDLLLPPVWYSPQHTCTCSPLGTCIPASATLPITPPNPLTRSSKKIKLTSILVRVIDSQISCRSPQRRNFQNLRWKKPCTCAVMRLDPLWPGPLPSHRPTKHICRPGPWATCTRALWVVSGLCRWPLDVGGRVWRQRTLGFLMGPS